MAQHSEPSTSRLVKLFDRPTGDILVLVIMATICFAVLATGLTIGLVELFHPESDTTAAQGKVSDVINTLIGLLAGFLAGRTEVGNKPPETSASQPERSTVP